MDRASIMRIGYLVCLFLAAGFTLFGCATLDDRSGGREQARALYGDAMAAMDAGELERAMGYLQRLEEEFGETPQGNQAVLEQAYVSHRLRRYAETIELVEEFMAQRRDSADSQVASEDVAYALFLRASAAHALWDEQEIPPDTGYARRAFSYYRQLVERFPEGKRIEQAVRRMNQIRGDLAAEELRRARVKMDAGNYAEAAERAAWVAEQYPGQRQAGDALALQAKALKRLGRSQEAEATLRMLEIKHPEHPAVSQE